MTLGKKQELFARLYCQLLIRILMTPGYEVRLGDVHRSVYEATRLGKRNSVHRKKIAGDLNLFKKGKFVTTTEGHRVFGEWWKQQHPLCRWGGDFGDGNHYSLEHNGVK